MLYIFSDNNNNNNNNYNNNNNNNNNNNIHLVMGTRLYEDSYKRNVIGYRKITKIINKTLTVNEANFQVAFPRRRQNNTGLDSV